MASIHKDQRGVSTLEVILIIIIVGIIGGVGWYVYHTKQNSDKSLDQATSTSQNAGPHFAKPKSDKSSPSSATSTTTNKTTSTSSSTKPQ